MAHMGLPQVWKYLHHRTDNTHILHEILGRYALSALEKPTASIQSHTVDLFVHLRIIFDIQRAYLQDRFPSEILKSYLIPAHELFASIRYLDRIRSENYGKISISDTESLEQRCFAARGLLSGLRALELWETDFPIANIDELQESVTSWAQNAKGNTLEVFILHKCIYLLEHISQNAYKAENAQIRKLSSGGQFGDLRKRANENFLRELKELRKGDEEAFWALLDLLWAAETEFFEASIQPLSGTGAEISHHQVNQLCEHLDDTNEVELCLKRVALEWCDDDASLHAQSHRWKSSNTTEKIRSTRQSIKDFVLFLEGRQSRILLPSEITHLGSELEDALKSWYHEASNLANLESSYNDALRIGRLDEFRDFRTEISCAYILNCPQLHILPWFCLKSLMSGDENRCIGEEPKFVEFQSAVRCPQCKDARYLKFARKIEPVHCVSNLIEEQVRKTHDSIPNNEEASLPPSPSTFSSQAPSNPPLREPKRRSFVSVSEGTASSNTEVSIQKPKSKKSWRPRWFPDPKTERESLPDTSKEPVIVLHGAENTVLSHGFSADSKEIILWDKEGGNIFASRIPNRGPAQTAEVWEWRKYDFAGVRLATSAERRVVGVSETSRLSVFSEPGSAAILDIQLKEEGTVRSLAISSQGESVAVGFDHCFLVYDIGAGNKAPPTIRQPLDINPKSHFNSQRLNFSRDGTKLIVATRKTLNSQGSVELNFHDELDSTNDWRRRLDSVSVINNDLGLSAVFFDNHVKRAIVAGFIGKPYHVVHSKLRAEVWSVSKSASLDHRFQAAAQSPTGSKFTFVNSSGRLSQLDMRQKQPILQDLRIRLDPKDPPRSADDFISVAMPDDKITHAFWIKERMGVLNTVPEGGQLTRRHILLPNTRFAELPSK